MSVILLNIYIVDYPANLTMYTNVNGLENIDIFYFSRLKTSLTNPSKNLR